MHSTLQPYSLEATLPTLLPTPSARAPLRPRACTRPRPHEAFTVATSTTVPALAPAEAPALPKPASGASTSSVAKKSLPNAPCMSTSSAPCLSLSSFSCRRLSFAAALSSAFALRAAMRALRSMRCPANTGWWSNAFRSLMGFGCRLRLFLANVASRFAALSRAISASNSFVVRLIFSSSVSTCLPRFVLSVNLASLSGFLLWRFLFTIGLLCH
mmetsp:Transcript_66787/g.168632  ORF Transcript_66787/g.168632 Transcript_66787/m.168632 type:complete len:214 (+) Transcript_66787:174-815(+)